LRRGRCGELPAAVFLSGLAHLFKVEGFGLLRRGKGTREPLGAMLLNEPRGRLGGRENYHVRENAEYGVCHGADDISPVQEHEAPEPARNPHKDAHGTHGSTMMPTTLVVVRCRWCGKPVIEVEAGAKYRLRHCKTEQVGEA